MRLYSACLRRPAWVWHGARVPPTTPAQRLARLGSRPQYVVCEGNLSLTMTAPFIAASGLTGLRTTFASTGFCNHNDAWTLRPSPARTALRAWWAQVVA